MQPPRIEGTTPNPRVLFAQPLADYNLTSKGVSPYWPAKEDSWQAGTVLNWPAKEDSPRQAGTVLNWPAKVDIPRQAGTVLLNFGPSFSLCPFISFSLFLNLPDLE
jgi:hypothetical protein